jgi:hypothetical protein
MSLLGFAMITASKFAASAVRSTIFPVFWSFAIRIKGFSESLNPIIALILSWLQPKFLQ